MVVESDGVPTFGVRTNVFAWLARHLARVSCTPTLNPAFMPTRRRSLGQRLEGAPKQQLSAWLGADAVVTARGYWDDPWVQTLIKPHAVAGVEPWASMWAAPPEQPVSKYRTQDISVVVLGGETQAAWKMVGGNFARAKIVKVDDWR
jgi:hypothetical protein